MISRSILIAIVIAAVGLPDAAAQTNWQSTSSPNWSVAANWSGGIPDQNATAQFASASATVLTTSNDLTNLLVNRVTVVASAAGPVSISGNAFRVQNGIDVAAGESLTITSGLGTVGNTSNFVKTGSGTLTLSGTPSFISNGQLQSGPLNVNTTFNGSLQTNAGSSLAGNGQITGSLTVNGTVTAGTGVGASTFTVRAIPVLMLRFVAGLCEAGLEPASQRPATSSREPL